jgi:hypothetical protein
MINCISRGLLDPLLHANYNESKDTHSSLILNAIFIEA